MSDLLFLEYSSPLRIYGDTNHIAQINRQNFYLDPAIPGLVDRRILVAIGVVATSDHRVGYIVMALLDTACLN